MADGPSQGNGAGGGDVDQATKREIVESRLITGALVSSVGVGALMLVLATVQAKWFKDIPSPFPPWLIIVPVTLAAAAFFWIVNLASLPRRRRNALRDLLVGWILALACVVISAVAFNYLFVAAHASPSMDQYALSLPLEAISSDQPAQKLSSAALQASAASPQPAATSPGRPALTAQPDSALLVWWVERAQPVLPPGTLLIFLGGIFIIAFGIRFPHIVMSDNTGVMGLGEKLVGPIFGLALVGLGTAQQTDAAKADQDVQLVRGGYPAVLGLTSAQNGNVSVQPKITYSPEAPPISADTVSYLQNQIDQVSTELYNTNHAAGVTDQYLNDLRQTLDGALDSMKSTKYVFIRGDNPSGLDLKLNALNDRVDQLQKFRQSYTYALDSNHDKDCKVLEEERDNLQSQIKSLIASANAEDQARRDVFNKHILVRITGRAPPGGNQDRRRAESLGPSLVTVTSEYDGRCKTVLSLGSEVHAPN